MKIADSGAIRQPLGGRGSRRGEGRLGEGE